MSERNVLSLKTNDRVYVMLRVHDNKYTTDIDHLVWLSQELKTLMRHLTKDLGKRTDYVMLSHPHAVVLRGSRLNGISSVMASLQIDTSKFALFERRLKLCNVSAMEDYME